jgi:hypothetical protein
MKGARLKEPGVAFSNAASRRYVAAVRGWVGR